MAEEKWEEDPQERVEMDHTLLADDKLRLVGNNRVSTHYLVMDSVVTVDRDAHPPLSTVCVKGTSASSGRILGQTVYFTDLEYI